MLPLYMKHTITYFERTNPTAHLRQQTFWSVNQMYLHARSQIGVRSCPVKTLDQAQVRPKCRQDFWGKSLRVEILNVLLHFQMSWKSEASEPRVLCARATEDRWKSMENSVETCRNIVSRHWATWATWATTVLASR